MKITLDTNVLISATFWHGDSEKIIEKVEGKDIELILSKEIIEEFARVLRYKEIQEKVKNKNLEMKMTVEKIISISKIVEPIERLKGISKPRRLLTREERDEVARNLTSKKSEEVVKKYNLERFSL